MTAHPAWPVLVALVSSLQRAPPVVVGPTLGLVPAARAAQGVRAGVLHVLDAVTAVTRGDAQVSSGCC